MRRFFAAGPVKTVEQAPDTRLVLTLARPGAAAVAETVRSGAGWVLRSMEGGWGLVDDSPPELRGALDVTHYFAEAWPFAPGDVFAWEVSAAPGDAFAWGATDQRFLSVRLLSWAACTLTATASRNGKVVGTVRLVQVPAE